MDEFLMVADAIFLEGHLNNLALQANEFDAPAPDQQSLSGCLLTEDEEGNMPCQIQQISLEGLTIAEAWRANATTNDMENLVVRVEPNTDTLSMPFCMLPVYHGTDWKIKDSEGVIHDPRNGILRPAVSSNQVALERWALAVVWTGFSPLRCFLWAAFKGEVLHQIPTGSIKAKLQRSWNCLTSVSGSGSPPSPHTHTGVMLFKFRLSLPSAFGQTYYVMPKGREAEWDCICKTHNEVRSHGEVSTLVKSLWDHFTPIHGGTLQTWQHALHCHEFGDQLNI
ncbi:hypothetical protein B0T25DRAFT_528748 [Lasiosphaeria hispida]|uniref:Uncharacterized protein n=1 Tax=Lasiosphaeria hispida TaxID=260671 RepID=A0AAJ0HWE6_9PEZI|nr:hypothetical protein B0T25DRAFT_528748 [Lasiosphaeria hispida]